MKKFSALALSIILVISLFAGCGKKTSDGGDGKVYYLNFKPEQDAAWQDLAKKYTDATGVPVSVVTASQGSYEETLTAEIDKQNAPTLFQISGVTALPAWKDYCLDLSQSDVYKQLVDDEFALKEGDRVYGIGYVYEGYGLIVNKKLLKKAGYEMEDITDFPSLKRVAEDIHTRAEELGFDAFTSNTLDSNSSWRFTGHLANIPLFYEFRDGSIKTQPETIKGTYLDNFKNLWDLYVNNSTLSPERITTAVDAAKEFSAEQAVFYQNGTWAYDDVKSVGDENLGMLPIYAGIDDRNQGLCCGTENYWAVNSQSSEADQAATLDFLKWLVTDEQGLTALSESMGFTAPFKKAKPVKNTLANIMAEYVDNGNYNVSWAFNLTPNVTPWRNELVSALAAYTTGKGDWSAVRTAFVDGWEKQYKASHS